MRATWITAAALTALTIVLAPTSAAQAQSRAVTGAAIGAGAGAIVLGPVGAVAGGAVGAIIGGPRLSSTHRHRHCWRDRHGRRHCRRR